MQRCETPWRSVRGDVLHGASLPGTRKPEYTSCILGEDATCSAQACCQAVRGVCAIAPLASGLRCAWPERGQPWTSAAWPPWVWREDGWTGPTMSERRTAGNRLGLKTQCGEAASFGEPWGSAEKRDHGLFWKKSRGFPLPPQVCTQTPWRQARTSCPGPGPTRPATRLAQLDSLAALPLSRLAGHPGQGATFHTWQEA